MVVKVFQVQAYMKWAQAAESQSVALPHCQALPSDHYEIQADAPSTVPCCAHHDE